MAPTPALTNILYVDYEGQMGQRSMQFRFGPLAQSDDAVALVDNVLTAIAATWHDSVQTTGMRWRAKGSTFSLPIANAPDYFGAVAGTLSGNLHPRFYSLSGRGLQSGAEVRLFVFGAMFTTPDDYRITASESSAIAAVWNFWQADVVAGGLVTWLEDPFTVRAYANVGFNSYYERKRRGSA